MRPTRLWSPSEADVPQNKTFILSGGFLGKIVWLQPPPEGCLPEKIEPEVVSEFGLLEDGRQAIERVGLLGG